MDEGKTEKKIEYWSKHQELDKFHHNQATSTHLVTISFTISIWIGVIAIGIIKQELFHLIYWVTGIAFITLLFSSMVYLKKTVRINKHFMAREIMIRYWYGSHFKLNTNELDSQNSQIMKLVSCFGRNVPKKLVNAIMNGKSK